MWLHFLKLSHCGTALLVQYCALGKKEKKAQKPKEMYATFSVCN